MPPTTPPSNSPTTVLSLDLPPKRGPGRPRTVRRAPTAAERAQQERLRDRLRQHVNSDPVVAVTSRPAERTSPEALDAAMLEIAREAAGLAFDRELHQVQQRPGAGAERIASRRISALSRLGELALERARAGVEDPFDPRSPKVQKVVALFLEQMKERAHEALPTEAAADFLRAFEARAAGWEDKLAT